MNPTIINKESENRNIVHPQKFVVWLLIVSIVMLFAALTSAYIVRRGEGSDWISHQLPVFFTYSTIVVLISSITMHFSTVFYRKGDFRKTSIFISITTVLGIIFGIMQVLGGYEWLVTEKIYFSGPSSTPRAQFVYLLALTHLMHIILALGFLFVLFIKSVKNIGKESFMIWLSNSAVFWHFLGLLWLYLFIFLTVIP
jgi:cytochrome c oxidase subunit 3